MWRSAPGSDRPDETAKALANETGRRVVPIVADTMSSESVRHLIEATLAAFGRVERAREQCFDARGMVRGPLAEADDKTLLEDIDTKVVGYLSVRQGGGTSHGAAPLGTDRQHRGTLWRRSGNISGLRNAAIVHLTKTLADELGAHGITVNLVHPGQTRTERTDAETERRAGEQCDSAHRRCVRDRSGRDVPGVDESGERHGGRDRRQRRVYSGDVSVGRPGTGQCRDRRSPWSIRGRTDRALPGRSFADRE